VGLIICIDQVTKLWVQANLVVGTQKHFFGWFWLTNHRHQGFALNLIQGLPPALQNLFFIIVPVFALFLIVLIFIKLQDNQMLTSLALTGILGGAIGNMIDRFESGPVLDVLEIRTNGFFNTPFNVADMAIIVGVCIVFINTLVQQRAERQS